MWCLYRLLHVHRECAVCGVAIAIVDSIMGATKGETMDRVFDAGRKAQGFKSQAHLDAFFRSYDHTSECSECQKPGRGFETSDGYQPTLNSCPIGSELYRQSFSDNF